MAAPVIIDPMAPNFMIEVQNRPLEEKWRDFVISVEYESAENMVDMIRIQLADPLDERGQLPIRNSTVFMPGNEVSLLFGYGPQLRFVGRGVIRKVRPSFPAQGIPMLEVVAYSKDAMMADSAPMPLREYKHVKATKKRKAYDREVKGHIGRAWKNAKYSDAVKDRAENYGFEQDIDETPEAPRDFIQKSGITDYDFVVGLSNLTGFLFWVDGDRAGKWTLHFKNPATFKNIARQSKYYTFKYGDGDHSTLLDFEPELVLQDSITKLMVQSKDPITGQIMQAVIEEVHDDNDPETLVEPGNVSSEQGKPPEEQNPNLPSLAEVSGYNGQLDPRWGVDITGNGMPGPMMTAGRVKIYIGEFSFDAVSARRFLDEDDLARWASLWFRANREKFMGARGTLIGIDSIRCRQIHELNGLGPVYNGQYYFTRVRHQLSDGQGYTLDFNARRLVPESAELEGDVIGEYFSEPGNDLGGG